VPASVSQDPQEAHRLPAVHAADTPKDDERTIPMLGRHPEEPDVEDDAEDTAPVIRGPWSAGS